MNEKFESILKTVSKPGRYAGGEYGQVIKDKEKVKARFAFCFPDTYEIGMSNLGVRILYGCLNREEDVWCERVYAPWVDMEEKMREYGLPLTAHESGDPIKNFDFVAFTLQYELCYTNVLNMLDLAGIPLHASDRGEYCPIIVGGGPCSYNAEPLADFFDCFSIGEGEEHLPELTRLYIKMKEDGSYTRSAFLHEAARSIPGTYVPSLYTVEYNPDGTVKSYTPKYDDVPARVRKRIITDLDSVYYPTYPLMPYIETVHDRIVLEVYRGCIRGCRFCQAGMVYRPVREKSPEVLCRNAKCLYESSGYDEISMTSLSISDYSRLRELCNGLLEWTPQNMVSLSLPSMRLDSFSQELMEKVESVRSASLTFAPEAGTQRLRDVINKNVTEDDLLRAAGIAFAGGKSSVKLYFMQGLPTETDEDIDGIAELAEKVIDCFYHTPGRAKRAPQVTISAACFIPKPFTPFQWEPQATLEELAAKQDHLYHRITDRKIKYNHHDATGSRIEAALARGDRRMSRVLDEAFALGLKFDAWTEMFSYEKWLEAFDRAGLDPSFYANRRFGDDEVFPWEVIDCGVSREFLASEREKAYAGITTKNCKEHCSGCGANKLGGERSWCPGSKNRLS